jgi:stress response protein YsnF
LHEEVDVERVEINEFVDGPRAVRQEGDVTVIPVMEEVLVVEKRLMLKEEIRLRRRVHETREPQQVTVRHEHVEVDRLEDSPGDAPQGT